MGRFSSFILLYVSACQLNHKSHRWSTIICLGIFLVTTSIQAQHWASSITIFIFKSPVALYLINNHIYHQAPTHEQQAFMVSLSTILNLYYCDAVIYCFSNHATFKRSQHTELNPPCQILLHKIIVQHSLHHAWSTLQKEN